MWGHFLHLIGVLPVAPGGSAWYNFWSGFGSDLTELAIVGALLGMLRKHNCHVHGCWRLGRHQVEGTQFAVCRHHNPDGKVTAQAVREARRLYLGRRPGRG